MVAFSHIFKDRLTDTIPAMHLLPWSDWFIPLDTTKYMYSLLFHSKKGYGMASELVGPGGAQKHLPRDHKASRPTVIICFQELQSRTWDSE